MKKQVIILSLVLIISLSFIPVATAGSFWDLTNEQKQFYWKCIKSDCLDFLKNKQYSQWIQCANSCMKQAEEYVPPPPKEHWCEDTDGGLDYFAVGTVTSDKYPEGKEDYCYIFPSGKEYLFEGACVNNKYQRYQKNCKEYGKTWACAEGACLNQVCPVQEVENGMVGDYPDCEITCNEGYHLEDNLCLADNHAPVLEPIGDKEVKERELLTFELSATDEDGDELSFFAENLPEGAEFIDNGDGTAVFTWKPNYEQAGEYEIMFIVNDNNLMEDVETIVISVVDVEQLTEFCGIVSEDTILTKENSPYVVKCHVLIEEGITLTIEPGVELRFDGPYYIKVEGTLIADGTEENMIIFTSNKKNPQPDYWEESYWNTIKFTGSSDNSIIDHSKIEYAKDGIRSEGLGSPVISYNIIDNIWNTGININNAWGASPPIVSHNIISNARSFGISAGSWSGASITYNQIENNWIGIHVGDGPTIVSNNIIINNEFWGMYVNLDPDVTIENNVVSGNGNLDAAEMHDGISGGIMAHSGDKTGLLIKNNIYDNINVDFRVIGPVDINIPDNWWGTTNTNLIEEQIYDFYDDFDLGKVNFCPYLDAPYPDGKSTPCSEIYDDFSGDTLDLTKWTERTKDNLWTFADEHFVDTEKEVYHVAQYTTKDASAGLVPTRKFQAGEVLEYDIIYNSGSGNNLAGFSRLMVNGKEVSLQPYIEGGCSTPSPGCGVIGVWNGVTDIGNAFGTYHFRMEFSEDRIVSTAIRPDSTTITTNYNFNGVYTVPYSLFFTAQTGANGLINVDYDNFVIKNIE